ncbi:DUF4199 domain-containing protein [Bernardetia sp. ABR2-2B]|uniref:DUF4199 domain-containing protein n=1 Tax=Bernardetia sp. ABR2-2B TaxID=3127472 RepID=UPI0030CA5CA5
MKSSVIYGLILGFITIILSILSYIIEIDTNSTSYLIGLVVTSVTLIVLVCYKIKQDNKGVISYLKAVQLVFTAFLISIIMSAIYTYTFNNYIATEYIELSEQKVLEETEKYTYKNSKSKQEAEQKMKKIKEETQIRKNNPFLYTLQDILKASIVALVISFLAAIFVQREPKENI